MMKKIAFVLVLCLAFLLSLSAQVERSGKVAVLINNKPVPVTKIVAKEPVSSEQNLVQSPLTEVNLTAGNSKYYGLIIGINEYSDPTISTLDNCVKDAESIYKILLSGYTFEKENVKFLKNATMAEIVQALDYFAELVKPEDNFVIFYAGHGYWDAEAEIGFWLPSDARRDSKLAWFRNSTLRDYLREIHSRHTLLITDACFGGSIFKSRAAFADAAIAINKLYELPSRKAMTSGTLTEVPDQSPFLRYLFDRLSKNNEKYLSAEQLFSSFRIAVINNSNAVPQFGEIKDVGDEGGDFVFIKKQ